MTAQPYKGWTTGLAYGLPALPLAALTFPVYIFLPTFYAQTLGLGLTATGIAILAARLIDMITDPIAGILSDRTKSRFGRRRPWIVAGVPLTLLAAWFLLSPPVEAPDGLYLLFWNVMLSLGWTMIMMPLFAWGAELSDDYNTRTAIMGWRDGLMVTGILGTLAIIAAFGATEDYSLALCLIFVMVLIALPPATYLLIKFVPDAPQKQKQTQKALGFRKGWQILRDNKPFRRLGAAYFINGLANAFPATLFLLFVQHVLRAQDQAGPLLFLYFLCGIVALPFWVWLSRRFGKHRTWGGAMLLACAVFMLVPLVEAGSMALYIAIVIGTGLTLGADLALPSSMQADVIDQDRAESGRGRAGLYFSLWSMITKGSLALAAGLAFPLLHLAGFSAEDGGNLTALIIFYAVVPVALKLLAIALMWNFPLNESMVRETRKNLAQN